MAAQHGHLQATTPLLKTVAAMGPQHVCMQDSQTGAHQWRPCCQALAQRSTGSRAASMTHLPARLAADELLLLSSTNPKSFDSRHIGPLSVGTMIVRVQLL